MKDLKDTSTLILIVGHNHVPDLVDFFAQEYGRFLKPGQIQFLIQHEGISPIWEEHTKRFLPLRSSERNFGRWLRLVHPQHLVHGSRQMVVRGTYQVQQQGGLIKTNTPTPESGDAYCGVYVEKGEVAVGILKSMMFPGCCGTGCIAGICCS